MVLTWHDLRIVQKIDSHFHVLQQAGNLRWCNWCCQASLTPK